MINNNIFDRFEFVVKECENHIAVICNNNAFTYKQFQSDIISFCGIITNRLSEIQFERQPHIAIYMHRGYGSLVALWSLIRLGLVYIPIDINTPQNRVCSIVKSSKADLIITDFKKADIDYLSSETRVLYIHDECNQRFFNEINSYGDFSYIIFTSGSTGIPKGVNIGSEALISFLESFAKTAMPIKEIRFLVHTSLSFDISLLELILPLLIKGTVVLCNENEANNFKSILRLVNQYQITYLQTTPSFLNLLIKRINKDNFASIKILFVGGEFLSNNLVKQVRQVSSCEIYNLYGPTEATIWCTLSKLNKNKEPTMGKAFGSTELIVVDDHDNIINNPNIQGQLYISGKQLFNGYYENEEATNKVLCRIENKTFYKTGDIVCYDEDKDLKFIGRIDNQVKINGNRVEIEEIETYIEKIPKVTSAIVIARKSEHKYYLECYFSAKLIINVDEIKDFLKKNLPDYMMPLAFIQIDKIPLTINGKKDRNKLINDK
jgi:amino acid adenylation domain-containing protein